jgi:hypothetical protein
MPSKSTGHCKTGTAPEEVKEEHMVMARVHDDNGEAMAQAEENQWWHKQKKKILLFSFFFLPTMLSLKVTKRVSQKQRIENSSFFTRETWAASTHTAEPSRRTDEPSRCKKADQAEKQIKSTVCGPIQSEQRQRHRRFDGGGTPRCNRSRRQPKRRRRRCSPIQSGITPSEGNGGAAD